MFVGHEFLAFALVGGAAGLLGADRETALALAFVAAVAALLPDLDVVYGLATYAAAVAGGTPLSWEAFWGVSNGVHRVATHPLPVGLAAALAFTAGAAVQVPPGRRAARSAGVVLVGAAAALVAGQSSGAAEPAVTAAFVGTAALAGAAVGRRTAEPASAVGLAAAVGLLAHPFGDLFMAAPPPLFAPVGPAIVTEAVVLAGDETLNLLAVLFVEASVVWAGLGVFARLTGRRVRDAFADRAAVGVGYAPAVFVLPRPTMADAHVLGFTVVPFAAVVGLSALSRGATTSRAEHAFRALVTGLATLTVAALAYLVAYVAAG